MSPSGDTLRWRLAKTFALPLFLLFAISGSIAYWVARHYADRVYDRWLYDSLTSLARQVRLTGDHAAIDLPRVAQEIFEWDDEDRTLFRVVGSKTGHLAGQADLPLYGTDTERFHDANLFDAQARGQRMRWASVVLDAANLGETVTVLVGETTNKRERLKDEILFAVWVPQLCVLLLVGLVTYRAIRAHTERIHTLSRTLRDMSVTRFHPLPRNDLPEELLPLLEALNAMIEKVDRAAVAQRSFIANAAHQLRTPLTTINLQAEQARHATSVDDMRAAVTALQMSASRAARLANQLLLLSRAEPDAQSAHTRTKLDLYDLAFETASEWAEKAVAAGFDLGFDDSSPHVVVEVDAALVREAINNLVDNALKHCPKGTSVTVSVVRSPDPAVVVEDTGPGIPEGERARVVKRFHRGDSAHAGGAGLGLAIVNEIALAHSGRFIIAGGAQGGARFEMHFPASAVTPRVDTPTTKAETTA